MIRVAVGLEDIEDLKADLQRGLQYPVGMTQVRTRFAPSPTGFIHLGNIRSALYSMGVRAANGGAFILRIEDTDVERSSQEAVDVILESMQWLGLDADEGPFYQMQRMDRYKAVLAQMLERGLAYRCYMSAAELDALRERAARGEAEAALRRHAGAPSRARRCRRCPTASRR